MNHRYKPWHAGAVALITCLGGGAFGAPPGAGQPPIAASALPAPSWAEAVEAAWRRSLDASETEGQRQRAQAGQASAGTWLSAPPALELAQREGQGQAARGQRETEVGLVLPLWRWGQRNATGDAARTDAAWTTAQERAARLRLAGEVRDVAAALLAQQDEAQLARAQAVLLQRLSADVERRVTAGDLAPADGWAVRAEWLAAQSQLAQQEQRLQAVRSQWQLLTGLPTTPAWPDPPASEGAAEPTQPHPESALASLTVERAGRHLAVAEASRGQAPELGLGVREERPGAGERPQRSVAISLRLPFGGTAHSQPALAAALAEQGVAMASAQRTRDRLAAELAVARLQQQSVAAQAGLEHQRAALLRERAHHLQKSFDAGESALPELLRALIAAAEADGAAARQRTAAALAAMRVQHALGIIP